MSLNAVKRKANELANNVVAFIKEQVRLNARFAVKHPIFTTTYLLGGALFLAAGLAVIIFAPYIGVPALIAGLITAVTGASAGTASALGLLATLGLVAGAAYGVAAGIGAFLSKLTRPIATLMTAMEEGTDVNLGNAAQSSNHKIAKALANPSPQHSATVEKKKETSMNTTGTGSNPASDEVVVVVEAEEDKKELPEKASGVGMFKLRHVKDEDKTPAARAFTAMTPTSAQDQ